MQQLLTLAGVLSEALSAGGLSLCTAVLLVLELVLDRGRLDVVSCPPAVEAEDDFARLSVVVGAAVLTGCALSGAACESRPRSLTTICRDSRCCDVTP